jgi:hypothetical protein
MAIEDQESAAILNLCGRTWAEEDPVKFLEVTMEIAQLLAREQQRLNAACDEAQHKNAVN